MSASTRARRPPFRLLLRRNLERSARSTFVQLLRTALACAALVLLYYLTVERHSVWISLLARGWLAQQAVFGIVAAAILVAAVAPPILAAHQTLVERADSSTDVLRLAGYEAGHRSLASILSISIVVGTLLALLLPYVAAIGVMAPGATAALPPLALAPFTYVPAGAAAGLLMAAAARNLAGALARYVVLLLGVPWAIEQLAVAAFPARSDRIASLVIATAVAGTGLLAWASWKPALKQLVPYIVLGGLLTAVGTLFLVFGDGDHGTVWASAAPPIAALANWWVFSRSLNGGSAMMPPAMLAIELVSMLGLVRLATLVLARTDAAMPADVLDRFRGPAVTRTARRWAGEVRGNPIGWRRARTGVGLSPSGVATAALVLVALQVAIEIVVVRYLRGRGGADHPLNGAPGGVALVFLAAGMVFAQVGVLDAFTRERKTRVLEVLAITSLTSGEIVRGTVWPPLRTAAVLSLPMVTHAVIGVSRVTTLSWLWALAGAGVSTVALAYLTVAAALSFSSTIASLLLPLGVAVAYLLAPLVWLPRRYDFHIDTYPAFLAVKAFVDDGLRIPAQTVLHMALLGGFAVAVHFLCAGPLLRRAIERGGR